MRSHQIEQLSQRLSYAKGATATRGLISILPNILTTGGPNMATSAACIGQKTLTQ